MKRCVLLLALLSFGSLEAGPGATVRFTREKSPRRISPYIYGFGSYLHENRAAERVWDLRPGIYRWGGNTSSRFNYKIDAWSSASDWYFRNYGGPQGMIRQFMAENRKAGAASMITLPMLPWIAKDRESVSYPRSLYPKQEAFDGEAGNGRDPSGKPLPSEPRRTSVPNSPEFVASWVRELKKDFGSSPHFYILDNEPMLWHVTHRDVQPEPMRYQSYLDRFVSFAKAVRKADPEAVIVGPAAWGWMEMQYSGYDIEGPWNNFQKRLDRKAHGDKPFLEWFLQELRAEEQKAKMSLLDVLDVHFYPEKDRWPAGDDSHPGRRKALLQATRSLWDRKHRDQSWIDETIYLIPRLQELAQRYKPTLKVSLGEYNFRSERDMTGAIAQAEALGIFAQTGLYAAHFWDFPKRDEAPRQAFELFRNYDGKGSGFAEEWIENDWGIREKLSVFAAQNSRQKRATLVLVNKDEREQNVKLDLKAWTAARDGLLVSYQMQGKEEVLRPSRTSIRDLKNPEFRLPGYSMHLLSFSYEK